MVSKMQDYYDYHAHWRKKKRTDKVVFLNEWISYHVVWLTDHMTSDVSTEIENLALISTFQSHMPETVWFVVDEKSIYELI